MSSLSWIWQNYANLDEWIRITSLLWNCKLITSLIFLIRPVCNFIITVWWRSLENLTYYCLVSCFKKILRTSEKKNNLEIK